MILYPAIDLKDGQCVRLLRGEMEAATVFGDNPAEQALKWPARSGKLVLGLALDRLAGFYRIG